MAMQTDYNQSMKEVLAGLIKKEKLLLHTCCAVCAGGVLAREFAFCGATKRLSDFFDITLYFYNPNIDTQEEYDKRAGELEKIKKPFGIREIRIEEYQPNDFLSQIKGFEEEFERSYRCEICIGTRLEKTALYAAANGYERVATTLSVSPKKSAVITNWNLSRAAERHAVPFLPADFKKENGFLAATQTAKELDIYRQTYCGCVFGKESRTKIIERAE